MAGFFSPFISKPVGVSQIMLKVLLALIPGLALYVWHYGPAILVSITLASVTALATEAAMLKLRDRPVAPFLKDNSALLTAWLIALSIPPLAPWWMVVVGTAFAISISKQLYGGLGSNPFNPAMIAYAILIISFPVHMTHWLTPHGLGSVQLDFAEQLNYIFQGVLPDGIKLDGVTMATPLDTLKTQLHLNGNINLWLSGGTRQ
jgi:electron transport complex protein RnfD